LFKKPGEFLYDHEPALNEVFERLGRLDSSLPAMEKIITYDGAMYQESIYDVLALSRGGTVYDSCLRVRYGNFWQAHNRILQCSIPTGILNPVFRSFFR